MFIQAFTTFLNRRIHPKKNISANSKFTILHKLRLNITKPTPHDFYIKFLSCIFYFNFI